MFPQEFYSLTPKTSLFILNSSPPCPSQFNETPSPFPHTLPLWLWWELFSCTGSTRCWPRRRFWMSWRWIYILYYPGCPSPLSIVWESPGFPLSPCPTGISGSSGDVATVGHSFKKKTKLMQVITDRVSYQTCIKWSASKFADIVKKMSDSSLRWNLRSEKLMMDTLVQKGLKMTGLVALIINQSQMVYLSTTGEIFKEWQKRQTSTKVSTDEN